MQKIFFMKRYHVLLLLFVSLNAFSYSDEMREIIYQEGIHGETVLNPCEGCTNTHCHEQFIGYVSAHFAEKFPEYNLSQWKEEFVALQSRFYHPLIQWKTSTQTIQGMEFRNALSLLHKQLTDQKKKEGLFLIERADQAYSLGDEHNAYIYKSLAQELVNGLLTKVTIYENH